MSWTGHVIKINKYCTGLPNENQREKKRTGLPDTDPGIPQEALQQPTMHQACQSTPVAQEK